MIDFIKRLFSSSPLNRAFKNCLEADQALLVRVITFHESYKAVGINLSPDATALSELDNILSSCDPDTHELTLNGVSAFLGCIVRETIGGHWSSTADGKYAILNVGSNNHSVDINADIRAPLADRQNSVVALYETIKDRAGSEPS